MEDATAWGHSLHKLEDLEARNGLLYLKGDPNALACDHADVLANLHGYPNAEQLVEALANPKPQVSESQEKMEDRGHHPYSPSSLNARQLSPCFTPTSGTNSAAERGTKQHAVADSVMDDLTLDDDEAFAVARALNYLEKWRLDIHNAGFEVVEIGEEYFPIDDVIQRDEKGNPWQGTTGGYPDKVLVWFPTEDTFDCVVADWKFGRYAVTPAKENLQGWSYVLGAVYKYRGKRKLRNATVAFFSPHRRDPLTEHKFTGEEMEERRLVIQKVVADAMEFGKLAGPREEWLRMKPEQYNALFRMSFSTCTFCANLGNCPKVADLAVKLAKAVRPVDVPADVHGWNNPRPLEVSEAFKVGDIAKNWRDAYRKRATDKCLEKDEVPDGYELQATYPREVLNPVAFYKFLREKLGEAADEFVDIPITPVEEYLKKQAPRGKKAAAVEEFAHEIEALGLVKRKDKPTVSLRMV